MRKTDHLLALVGLQRIPKRVNYSINVNNISSMPHPNQILRDQMASIESPELLAARSMHAARKRSRADHLRMSNARVIANIRAAEAS